MGGVKGNLQGVVEHQEGQQQQAVLTSPRPEETSEEVVRIWAT